MKSAFVLIVSVMTANGGVTDVLPLPTIELCHEIKAMVEHKLALRGVKALDITCERNPPKPVFRPKPRPTAKPDKVVPTAAEAPKPRPAKAKPTKKVKAKCIKVRRYRIVNGKRKWYTRCRR